MSSSGSAGSGWRRHRDQSHRVLGLNRRWACHEGWSAPWSLREMQGGELTLPHSWNARDSFQEGVRYHQGAHRYERLFDMPAETEAQGDALWRLVSEGFYGSAHVLLNSRSIWKGDGQYLGFRQDVSEVLVAGEENRLRVLIDNRYRPDMLPGIRMPDFLLFGGLSGRLYLERRARVRVEYDGLRMSQQWSGDQVEVRVQPCVCNDRKLPVAARVLLQLIDAGGTVVASADCRPLKVTAGGTMYLDSMSMSVRDPERWSVDRPYLYELRCQTEVAGETTDDWSVRIGLREAEFRRGEGFLLNGERVELRGWNRHESMPGFGRALHPELHRVDARMLKNAGGNLVRLSHYPQHPEFLDACDELGILTFPEVASWKSVRGGRWLRAAERQMRGMIRRDRLHPSVILWGMANESRSREAFDSFGAIIGELDAGRPSIYAENHLYRGRREKTLDIPDVLGVNYEISELEEALDVSRNGVALVSECSNNPEALRGHLDEEIRQVDMIRADVESIRQHPAVAGYALWCMNDYATLRKERYRRYSGLIDAWRMPKPAYDYFRAINTSEPFVTAYGGLMKEGVADTLHIFTNQSTVNITDGDGARSLKVDGGYLKTAVMPAEDGVSVTVSAAGEAVECRVTTYSRAGRIEIRLADDCPMDTPDLLAVDIEVQDNDGRRVRDWNDDLLIDVCGEGEAVYYTAQPVIRICGGVGRLYVRALGEGGPASVRAESGCLSSGHLDITLRADIRSEL